MNAPCYKCPDFEPLICRPNCKRYADFREEVRESKKARASDVDQKAHVLDNKRYWKKRNRGKRK